MFLVMSEANFLEFIDEKSEDTCLEIEDKKRLTDDEAKKIIMSIGKVSNCPNIQNLGIERRSEIIKKLKEKGISVRQLERITGINRGVILKS